MSTPEPAEPTEPPDRQVAQALAAELDSLSPECRADAARLDAYLAPDFHEYGASGASFGREGVAERVAAGPHAPIEVEDLRGRLLAEGLVLVTYTATSASRRTHRSALWRRVAPGRWQVFHHQGTPTRS